MGTISANGDPAFGSMIVQAMERMGRDGVINAEDGRGMENELHVVEELQFDCGILSLTLPKKAGTGTKQLTVK